MDFTEHLKEQAIRDLKSILPPEFPFLSLQVARIIKEQMEIGVFDYCTKEEMETLEEFVHTQFLKGGE